MMFSANVSIMYSELPFLDRFEAARMAGFTDVECWWPFSTPTPADDELGKFLASIEHAGVTLRGLNFYAGDMAGGDRGLFSHPDATDTIAENVSAVRSIAEATGCRVFNALYGHNLPGVSRSAQNAAANEALRGAIDALAPLDPTILIEPLTRGENGDYPLTTINDAIAVIDRVNSPSVRLLFDAYHLYNNGADIYADVVSYADRIGHIQIADSPGRGRPGTGEIDFDKFYAAVTASSYEGFIGCEYREPVPTGLPST